ncbi:hypothetical protein P7C73_g2832, partial [Tremellales sp. Uapishka_1]
MLSRSLYSSLPPSRSASGCSPSTKPSISTRGRSKPSARRLTGAKALQGSSASSPSTITPPTATTENSFQFQPIRIYPAQMKLLLAFTPSHFPLPVGLGPAAFTSPKSSQTHDELFTLPPPPSPASIFENTKTATMSPSTGYDQPPLPSSSRGSVISDHLHLMSCFSRPSLSHHLGDEAPVSSRNALLSEFDGDTFLTRSLASASVKTRLGMENDWETVLSKLSSSSLPKFGKQVELKDAESKIDVDNAVMDLNAMLSKMEMTGRGRKKRTLDEGWVNMDSVKRKRQKKMSKHKYKKRRKATRAQRKRLGK